MSRSNKSSLIFLFLTLLSIFGCESEPETTTTPPVANPFPEGGVSILLDSKLTSPRFRFHDGTVENYQPRILKEVPDLPEFPVSSWYVTQWKKPSLMLPHKMLVNPQGYTDPVYGDAFIRYFSDEGNPNELSSVNVYRDQNKNRFIYELNSRGGWLDTGGGTNVFLTGKFQEAEKLDKRIDLNFSAKIKDRYTEYFNDRARNDGSVVSQFFAGSSFFYKNPEDNSLTHIFVQITFADSRYERFLAPGKLEYRGCYKNDFGSRQIVYGNNMPNALGGNGFIAGATPNSPLQDYSFNINDQICTMIKKPFKCQDGSDFYFPENAKTLENWTVNGLYFGLETQEALAEDFSKIPTVSGPKAGKSSISVQLADLDIKKYPNIQRLNCNDPAPAPAPNPNPTPTPPVVVEKKYCDLGFYLQDSECHPTNASINAGRFCSSANQTIAWQCGGKKPQADWVDAGSNCYHYNTQLSCQAK